MIDQFNEIKREEEENRNHLKLKKNKENENDYILFNKKVQESIENYKPSFTQSTIIMMDYINFNNAKKESKIFNENSISISLNFNNDNLFLNDINSSELTLISITNNINTTPTKNKKSNNNKLSFTPSKKKLKSEKIEFGTKNNNDYIKINRIRSKSQDNKGILFKNYINNSSILKQKEKESNKRKKNKSNSINSFVSLYNRSMIHLLANKKNIEKIKDLNINNELSECSFHPKIYINHSLDKKLKNYKQTKIYQRGIKYQENR